MAPGAVPRIGVFGGAFDPPHRAHRALAATALAQLQLDALVILPTGRAWHKARPLTPFAHRWAMCERAFGDLPGVRLDDREQRRDGPSYTVDTLQALAHEHPGARWFLIIGADQWRAFTTWHRWADVLQMATLVVAERPAAETASPTNAAPPSAALAAPQVAPAASRVAPAASQIPPVAPRVAPVSQAPDGPPFVSLNAPLSPVSATQIRSLAAAAGGDPAAWAALVPEPVARYISQHSLYQDPS